ncbi:MFS transporter [Marinitenerispora sediminis]|uniref:MFS transporter n=1 Tax=Marinitenerispora sediminis TaxID=1931232 RepID=A0A368TAI5_9ACTN|nr:MFS transporter [Marinitenerispora sediminis]RCV51634.1 MFS transporter [Marinitenerispora sediminis]RCV52966.1 MFS transporter [Marinitenerispora sediminis]RCV61775.1 MFS transporter [Marinitenerispora sediminis]
MGTAPPTSAARRALWAFALAAFCVQLDAFALTLALPSIARDLGVDGHAVAWAVSGYLLTCGALMIAGGRLADRYGRRPVFAVGLAVFGAASLVCGLSTAFPALVAGRAAQGVGGALLMPAGLALVSERHPAAERARATGRALGIAGAGTVLGPLVGGVVTEAAGWRWVFLGSLAVVAAALALTAGLGDGASRPRRRTAGGRGLILLTCALGLVALYVERAPEWGWAAPRSVLAAACAAALIGGFAAAERRSGRPVLDPRLWRSRRYLLATALGAVANAAAVHWLVTAPMLLQHTWGMSAGAAGVALSVPVLAFASGGPLAGRLATGRPAVPPLAFATAIGAAAVLPLPLLPGWGLLAVLLPVGGLALGTANALALIAAQRAAPDDITGEALGVTKTAVTVAGGLGA